MDCLFCKIINKEIGSVTIYEDEKVIAFLDINPTTNGDTLIMKKQDDCDNGEFCAVSINHTECTFKKVIKKSLGTFGI